MHSRRLAPRGVLAIVALGCGTPATPSAVPSSSTGHLDAPAPSPPVEAAPVAVPTPSPPSPLPSPPSPSIAGFDCRSTLEEKQGEQLRDDNAGPLGATWNWHAGALRCGATLRDACAGSANARLHVGDRHIVQLERDSSDDLTFDVPPATWTPALRSHPRLPYDTLLLALEVVVLCEDGPLHLTDAFVGRFGAGE